MFPNKFNRLDRLADQRTFPFVRAFPPFRRCLVSLYALTLLPLFASVSALAQEPSAWLPYPEDGITLGQGFDMLNNRKTPGVCVDFIPVEDPGLETTYHLSTLNSFSDIFSSMNINASGALDMSTVLTASVQLDFANNIRTTKTDDKFLFNADIQRGVLYTSPQYSHKLGARHPIEEESPIDRRPGVVFRNDLPNSRLDFVTQCGHGFVSAIVTGVQVTAAIDTSTVESKSASTYSASLKLEVLGGLISGSGSAKGESEEGKILRQSSISSYIKGGESYSLPRDIPELSEFVHNLPALAVEKPRPTKIAVTPYSVLSITSDVHNFNVFADASSLRSLVYTYFAAREARQRIADVVDEWNTLEEQKLFVIPGNLQLFQETHVLTRLMSRTQVELRSCQSKLSRENAEAAKKAAEKVQIANVTRANGEQASRIQQIYAQIEADAQKERTKRAQNGGPACDNAELVESLVMESAARYIFSLVAMPIIILEIDDPLITNDEFKENVRAALSDESETLDQIDALQSEIREKRKSCENPYDERLDNLYRRYNNLPPQRMEHESPKGHLRFTIDEIERERNRECEKVVLNDKGKLKELIAKLENVRDGELVQGPTRIVSGVLAREIYKRRFYPLLRSMCEVDSQYVICGFSYDRVMKQIVQHIVLGKDGMRKLAQIIEEQ